MKLDVFLMGSKDGTYRQFVDQVVLAEELGLDGAWLAERHFANGDLLWPSPLVAAAFLAARTERIRIGLAARVLPLHHPLHVAADAATVDTLSGGRLDLGLSRGSMDDAPHRAFGVSREEARLRFDEATEILLRALRGEPFSFHGRHYELNDVVPAPRCVQRPHPPVYLVANNPASLDAAADHGLPVFLNGALAAGEIAGRLERYQARARAAGHEVETSGLPVNRFVFVGESKAHARRAMREPFLQFLERRAPDLRAYLVERQGGAPSFEQLAERIAIFDDAEGCAARLEELEALGVGHVLCTFNLPTLGQAAAVSSMRRFAAEVAPLFQGEGTRGPRSVAPRSAVRTKEVKERRPRALVG